MRLTVVFISALFFLCSCSGSGGDSVVTVDLAANVEMDSYGNPGDFFEIESVIHPEFTDSSMLSMFNLCGVVDNRIFIEENQALMTFDKNTGKCLSSFDRVGNGPGEYRMIYYRWPQADGKGWVVENIVGGNRILAYDLYGNCSMEKADTLCDAIYPFGTGWAGSSAFSPGDNMRIYFYDSAWRLTDSLNTGLVYETMESGEGPVWMSRELSCVNNRLFIENNDTLYSVDRYGLHPEVVFSLGAYAMPHLSSFEEMYNKAENYIRYSSFIARDMIFVAYTLRNTRTLQVYSREGKLLLSRTARGEEPLGFPFVVDGVTYYALPAQYSSGDYIYLGIDEMQVAGNSGTDDCNPVLLEVRIKGN